MFQNYKYRDYDEEEKKNDEEEKYGEIRFPHLVPRSRTGSRIIARFSRVS